MVITHGTLLNISIRKSGQSKIQNKVVKVEKLYHSDDNSRICLSRKKGHCQR